MKIILLLCSWAAAFSACSQQVVSPEVWPDGRVTFRLSAPNAREVKLQCEAVKATNMQKDAEGVWSLTSEPLAPDIYIYSFSVDGMRAIDTSNPLIRRNLVNPDNQVHVPGPKTLPWEINDVPRGQLHHHYYHSTVASDERDFMVYTPPGYDPAARKRYPVLYLLHGYSDTSADWTTAGRANIILDNLIARGQANPMVIVMPLGYGTMEIIKQGWQGARDPVLWQRNVDKFRETLLNEVMPQAERAYRISPDRKSHAIAGLSMGGTESLLTGLNHLDRFAWIGAFGSGGLSTNFPSQFPTLDEKANGQLRLLWIGCGTEDRLLANNQHLHQWLQSQGVRHTWVETPGGHNHRLWRRYLIELVPLLFR